MTARLVLATQNAKKGRELAELCRDRFIVLTMKDVGLADLVIDETGATFADNARIKARAVMAALAKTGELERSAIWAVIADDSGLCVDALDGRPGVRSARLSADLGYRPPGVSIDEANNRLLLHLLGAVPSSQRGAHFACAVAALLVSPTRSLSGVGLGPFADRCVGSSARGDSHAPAGLLALPEKPGAEPPTNFGPATLVDGKSSSEAPLLEAFATSQGRIAFDQKADGGFGYDPLFIVDSGPPSVRGRRMSELSADDKHAISHRGHAMRALLAALPERPSRFTP